MILNKKNLAPLGFRCSHYASNDSLTLHWRKRGTRIEVADGITNQLGTFDLSKAELRAFNKGKLALVPPGCCSPCSGKTLEEDRFTLLHKGAPKSKKHLEEIFSNPTQ